MNILFLSISDLNSVEDQGIYNDLMRQFRDNGHQVYIVNAREKRLKKSTEYITEKGVHFLKVKIGNITQNNLLEKGVSTLMLEGQFLRAIKKYLKHVSFDLIIYSTPPITFEKVIRFIKKRDNATAYLLLKDIFPQNAVDLNMFRKNSLIYKYFRGKEKRLYNISDYIGCMSQANLDFIRTNNPTVPVKTLEICPNSIDPILIPKEEMKTNDLRKKYNIPSDKTIFIYGGNLGKPQAIDFIIQCIEANQSNEQAFFVIVGSGTEFNKVKTYFDTKQPSHAKLIKEIPKDEYESLANSCDVGLIFLDHRFTIPNFPSRLLSYMQAAIPVLAATDVHTDIRQVIEQGEFGLWCASNDVEQFNEKVQQLANPQLRVTMGKHARTYLEENYTAKHSYEIIMKHFK
ncbi:glycosyltransferase family 4 protein [Lysinibacillus sp. LZ02]|uniref:glycosyltransferase family 4 protein n=1 Tax=Lysinibacillus sp. LZ02 TaxID=3420668 RepID=UPI003D36E2D4